MKTKDWHSIVSQFYIYTGNIPKEIGRLNNLVELQLEENNFNGSLPEEIENMTQLTYLWLNNNNLDGMISYLFRYYL